MPHFDFLPSLGHGPGGILDSNTAGVGSSLTGTISDATKAFFANVPKEIESGLSTRRILNRIESLVDRNLIASPQFQFDKVQVPLFELGQATQEQSSALNEEIALRERQRAVDNEALSNLQIQTNAINERLSSQVQELGTALTNIGTGQGIDPIKFLTDNPLIGGIGIGGLLVAGVVLLVVLK